MYASLEQLRETVTAQLDREDLRVLFEYHKGRVAELVASQPDVAPSETTIAGFLNGFRTATTTLADDPELTADTMHAQLGGIFLYAVETLIHDGTSIDAPEGIGFFARLTETLRREPAYLALTDDERRAAQQVVRSAFAATPDVPINATSLAGFVLGLLYATPFVAERGVTGVVALMDAAMELLPPV